MGLTPLKKRLYCDRFPHGLAGQHLLGIGQFTPLDVASIMRLTDYMRESIEQGVPLKLLKVTDHLKLWFDEGSPSTRTRGSFVEAMCALGGTYEVLRPNEMSLGKGESEEATMLALSTQCKAIVMRTNETGEVQRLAEHSTVPVINAGDGNGEHFSQALLDLYAIRSLALDVWRNQHPNISETSLEELLEDFCVVLAGDLARGRTVHSLAPLLARYKVRFRLVSHPELRMPSEQVMALRLAGCQVEEHDSLDPVLPDAHVLYATRDQNERRLPSGKKLEQGAPSVVITPETLDKAKKLLALMHPLPHGREISGDFSQDPRAIYRNFQMKCGVWVRMALLAMVFDRVPCNRSFRSALTLADHW